MVDRETWPTERGSEIVSFSRSYISYISWKTLPPHPHLYLFYGRDPEKKGEEDMFRICVFVCDGCLNSARRLM